MALPDDEAAHLTRVLRLKRVEAVRVFDGRGREWDAEVEDVTKRGVTVRLGAAMVAAPEPRVSIALAVALLKGEKMDQVIRDAVMLGVTQVIPLLTARTEVGSGADGAQRPNQSLAADCRLVGQTMRTGVRPGGG